MKITVSGETKEVKDGITISELISQENVETPEYVSVSVNEEFAHEIEEFNDIALLQVCGVEV